MRRSIDILGPIIVKRAARIALLLTLTFGGSACASPTSVDANQPPNKNGSPTLSLTPAEFPEPVPTDGAPTAGSTPEAGATECETQEPSKNNETQSLNISAYIELVPGSRQEKVTIYLSPTQLDALSQAAEDSPGENTSVIFSLESLRPFSKILFNLDDILGPQLGGGVIITMDATSPSEAVTGAQIRALVEEALAKKGVTPDEATLTRIEDMQILSGFYEPKSFLNLQLLEERYLGNFTFIVDRSAGVGPGVVMSRPDVTVADFQVVSADGEQLYALTKPVVLRDPTQPPQKPAEGGLSASQQASSVEIKPVTPTPRVVTVATVTTVEGSPTAVATGQPLTQGTPIVHESGDPGGGAAPSQRLEGSASATSSEWGKEDWQPDEAIPIREWWNDMLSRGLIIVNPIAQSEVDKRLNNLVMVPNPVNYRNNGVAYAGGCEPKFREAVAAGRGFLTISAEAYRSIPGGAACQLFAAPQ
ncbi:hypothetical protein KA012_02295 [Candidatus Woesebacteria bacterium]|nr:hypothetical protein [Candidatus Woesebacteria bacterium]